MSKTKQTERIRSFYEKWKYLSESFGWKTKVVYCKNRERMPEKGSDKCLAITYTDFKYLVATIYWNLDLVSIVDDDELEHAVVHEITHLLLSAHQENPTEQNLEYVTTCISRCFCGLRNNTQ